MPTLLPPNATALEKALEATLQSTTQLPIELATLWDAKHCDEALLPWLAWALSVDVWDSTWPVAVKREIIASSILVHRQKGTLKALKTVLENLSVVVDIAEWFEYGGTPHTFQLRLWVDELPDANTPPEAQHPVLDGALFQKMQRAVDLVKPVRSHYTIRVGVRWHSDIGLGSLANISQLVRLSGEFSTGNNAARVDQ